MITRFAICIAFVAACGGKKSDDSNQPITSTDTGSAGEAKVDEPPKLAPMTPKKLAPIIRELGTEGVVPTSIVIELAAPIVDRDSTGVASGKSVLKIKPEIAGQLVHTGPSQLTFTPNAPFDFDTTYEVQLLKVDTRDGVIDGTAEGWTHSFKTPAFKFVGWAPNDVDLVHHRVTMEINFTGAVLPNIARAQSVFSINGTPTNNVQVLPNRQPNKMLVLITDPAIDTGAKLALAIKQDMPSLAGAKLPAVNVAHTLKADKPVSIKTAQIVEGTSGYYLEVICDDKAATPGNRAFYEHEGYYNMSQRCQLSDDMMSHVHITPALKKPYITSGRAGFRIFGDWKRGVYQVKIDAGAQSVDGGTLLAPFSRSFAVSARKTALAFTASGRYLPRKAWSNLGIKHTNIEAVNLIVRQVPPENLVFWLGNTGSDAADDRTSNVVLRKTIPLRGDLDVATTTWLDVGSMMPTTSTGVLELKLVGVGTQSTSRLLLTNMSLVAKKTTPANKPWFQTVNVWALDMDSGAAMSGVEITLVRKSGKVVAKCTTAGGDGCVLEHKNDADPDQAEAFALIARKGDDLTYLRYQDLKADIAESSTSGQPYVASTPYRASIYSDRGVYRPGDTAHVVAIVRDAKDKAPDQALPVDVKLIDPRAKVVKKLALKTNAAGQIAFDHALPAFADTGHWRVQLAVADKALAAYDLQVEEFVPERMKVTATPKTPMAMVGSKVAFDISAQYLFGGSAIDSGVTVTCAVEPDRFEPTENADLTYGVAPKGKPVSLGESRDQLDPKGMATVACPAPEATTQFTQTAKVEATIAVLEAGSGRATVRTAEAMLHPEKYYIGVKTKARTATAGQTFTVEGLIVDWNGKPAPSGVTKLDVELIHLEADYGYGYDSESGESSYERSLRTVPEGRQQVAVTNGTFKLDVTPADADAGYMVRLRAGKATTELVLDGTYPYDYYSEYGDGGRVDQTPRPAKPTQLAVKGPTELKVGEAATVKVLTPYRGKLLWTVETDRVVKSEWKDVTGGEASWEFKLPAFAPNVYVTAFLVKDPHLESKDAFLPDRAFGVSSIRVVPVEFTQAVKIEAPKEVRSSSQLTIGLDLGPGTPAETYATIAVVDEGILSLTKFKTPDPNAQLFSRRALGVETFETIGWTMLHQPAGASSKTGGGDDGEAEADGGGGRDRVQPVKPVAMFSGIVKVGPNGKLSVPFQVPSFRGKVRVMAITASPTKVGRAEAEVLVRDPLVVQVTFPRFVTQGDEMQIPVFLTNVSGGPLDVQLSLTSEVIPFPGLAMPKSGVAPLTFDGKDKGSVRIENGRAETLVFATKANMPIGGAKLRVLAKAKGAAGAFDIKDEVDVPFLPAGPKERTIQKIKVEAGTLDLAAKANALKNWVPTSEQTTFWLTANPYGESFEHLKYLVHYPYGCIEQTTSSTRPLLYVGGLVEQVDPKLAELKLEDMVLSGINRIFSMQTPSGGFGYWPGATDPQEWGTAYATHMLLDAKKAGYAVPDDRLNEVLAWIDQRALARERGTIARASFRYYDEQAEAYLHYVLALAGKGKKARILRLISQFPPGAKGEQAEDLYMLKAALFHAGDRRYERDLKAVDASPISAERVNSWSFYSDQRRRGLMLTTFFDLFGNDAAGEPLAQRVAEGLTGHHSYYYNTQELVWGITGLGKWVNAQRSRGTAAGKLVADGATIDPRKTKSSTDKTWALARASEYKSLTIDIPQSSAGMWLVINSEGVRPGNAYKLGGNGLSVTRRFRSLDGTELDPAAGELKLGDLVFVEIELANTSGAAIQNIALVDRLPGGFEVENPRLGRTTKVDWVKDDELWGMDFMNMRDDRLEAFGYLPAKTSKKIVYTVRAVTSGKYTIPPVEAEAMYDPTLWARAAAGTAVIGGPWTGKTL